MKNYDRISLVWLRRDLRLEDNTALFEAGKIRDKIAVVFVFDSMILDQLKNKSDQRVSFIFQTLEGVNHTLQKHGSELIVKYGNPTKEIPKLIQELNATSLFFNEDYEDYAKKRDQRITAELTNMGVPVFKFKDHVIFSAQEVLKPNKDPYRKFTPYKNAWLNQLSPKDFSEKKVVCHFLEKEVVAKHSDKLSWQKLEFQKVTSHLPFQKPTRENGIKILSTFQKTIQHYKENRNFPGIENGTSGLSVHLRFGTLSVRECVKVCIHLKNQGAQTWLSEIIWRDFYAMILDQFPHVETGCFQKQYDKISWENRKDFFDAWCHGKTGYPIIDAGMRQLNQTGWMHNRVRMCVASFLVKDLLLDWRKGENYFAKKLLDYELSSNNGGWQWCASTGCDAQPYFRIFNPSLQSKRYDPDAIFIKKWIPELKNCTAKEIHSPETSQLNQKANYPKPIVSHATQKQKITRMFQKI